VIIVLGAMGLPAAREMVAGAKGESAHPFGS